LVETFADMKANSLAIVTISRTIGMLCRVTGSGVSKAAAMSGKAEFLAPAICSVP